MKTHKIMHRAFALTVALFGTLKFTSSPAFADPTRCGDILANFNALKRALTAVVNGDNGPTAGLGNQMWATIVNRDGAICAVYFSGFGNDRTDAWPGSRVISMQKAYTANAFSLDGFALSTANIWAAVQPGGSLFGLQFSNPVNPAKAYADPLAAAANYGTGITDPAVGEIVGGINVFGGGLPLYNGSIVGAIGVSGDTSCRDHIVAWKIRDLLDLDNVPAGVAGGTDNIIFDITGSHNNFQSKSGFGHPECGFGERPIAEALPTSNPIGP